MKEILVFLLLFNCIPTTNIIIDNTLDKPGYYCHNSGRVYLRDNASDVVKVHELFHSCQLKATSQAEQEANEQEAHLIELKWLIFQGKD